MKVKLVRYTPRPDETVAAAARLCYSSTPACKISGDTPGPLIDKLLSMGHESPFEHISFTFAVDGISRATSHQLVRHRIASYSQKSQRYVKEDCFDYIVPPTVFTDKYDKFMEYTADFYRWLVANGVPREDARYVLPNATATSIIVTMSARSLFNFFSHRCCNRAQWEIRELADEMLKLCKEVAPITFSRAGAPCVFGACTEGSMTCGEPRRK